MWDPLQRARRLLLRDDPATDLPAAVGVGPDTAVVSDLTFALGRAELERLTTALERLVAGERGRVDTPARLEAALRDVIDHVGGLGQPTVTRRPAGVYTPEAWEIAVTRADHRTQTAIEGAIRTGGLDA